MKWYSHRAYKQHLEDLKYFKDSNEARQIYMAWAKTMANRFDRSYARIGVLNLQDLLQEGYCAFYKAWEDLNWDIINSVVEEERPAVITFYIKRRVEDRIKRAVARDRDTIRIPENYYRITGNAKNGKDYKYDTDIFLTRTFASFFTPDYLDIADDGGDYMADRMSDFLNDVMESFLPSLEKMVIKMFYGIDEAYDKPMSHKRIAEYFGKSENNIKKIKQRGLDKLKIEEVKNIINKFIENEVTY